MEKEELKSLTKTELIKKLEEKKVVSKLPSLSPMAQRMIIRKLGLVCSERMGIDLVYAMDVINNIIYDKGKEYWKQKFTESGKDFDAINERLIDVGKKLEKVREHYEPIKDKRFERKVTEEKLCQIQQWFRSYFIKTLTKIPLMKREIYDTLFFLINNTSLKIKTIPTSDFRSIEHEFKAKDLTKKRFTEPLQSNVTSENVEEKP